MSSHSPYIKPNVTEEKNLSTLRFGDPQKEYEDSIIGYGSSKVEPIMDSKKIKNIILRQKERLKDLDIQIGHLLSFIENKNLKKNTVFILTSDHGPNHLSKKENYPMMNKMRLNIPLLIYDFKSEKIENNENYICQTDILSIVKNLINNNPDNLISPINKKEEVISESIFNDKYQASIHSENYKYYFSCLFDPKKFEVNFENVLENKLEIISMEQEISEDQIIFDLKEKIKKQILKSKKIKLK
jgi:phosphoglycerol transferase MdoB-like AlkP superfamily enzyme